MSVYGLSSIDIKKILLGFERVSFSEAGIGKVNFFINFISLIMWKVKSTFISANYNHD